MIRAAILFVFLFTAFRCDTSSTISPPNKSYFVKYFGGDGNQKAVGLIVNTDGTFFILGNSRVSTGAIQQVYLAKADALGNKVWEVTYGTTEMDAKDFAVANGSLVVVANKKSVRTDMDIQLIKFTLDGDTVQSAVLQMEQQLSPTPKNEWANSLTTLNDGGFLISGYTDYVGATLHTYDALHFRTDNNFNQKLNATGQWIPTSGRGVNNYAAKAFQVSGDTTYVFGYTDGPSPPSNDEDFWAFKLDSKGVQRGVSNYVVNSSDDILSSALKATQGGYLLSGLSIDKSSQNFSLKIAKIRFDNLGFDSKDIQYNFPGKSLGKGGDMKYATACNSVTGYFALTNIFNSAGVSDIMLIKLDVTLQETWSSPVILGGDGDDTAAAVAELSDGHIIVLGTMNLGNPAEQFKIALIKLNSAGRLSE